MIKMKRPICVCVCSIVSHNSMFMFNMHLSYYNTSITGVFKVIKPYTEIKLSKNSFDLLLLAKEVKPCTETKRSILLLVCSSALTCDSDVHRCEWNRKCFLPSKCKQCLVTKLYAKNESGIT